MGKRRPILALYDFRGKQAYIYRTNRLKEISGASDIIREGFKGLYESAMALKSGLEGVHKGIYDYRNEACNEAGFTWDDFWRHMSDGYCGEIIYEGGGNLFILYDSDDTCITINKLFTTRLMRETWGLQCLCSYTDALMDSDDFIEARKRLFAENKRLEMLQPVVHPVSTLPIIQVDRMTSIPMAWVDSVTKEKVSIESMAKLKKYEMGPVNALTKHMDGLITEKGVESLLAVVYIDGNNMGKKVENYISDSLPAEERHYAQCVNKLRDFSLEIQHVFVDAGMEAVDEALEKHDHVQGTYIRNVVSAGDEVTFICNAKAAFVAAKAYLESVAKNGHTACAGIAVFNSHAPFAAAYQIAEACCESGKKRMKKYAKDGARLEDSCLIDFHYCQGSIDSDLMRIRHRDGLENNSLPWFVYVGEKDKELLQPEDILVEDIMALVSNLNQLEHGNIKSLAQKTLQSPGQLMAELNRIVAHNPEIVKGQGRTFFECGKLRGGLLSKVLYNIVLMYDLWFYEGR